MSDSKPQTSRAPAISLRVPTASNAAALSPTRICVRNINAFYGAKQALFDVNLEIPDNAVTAFIGPSGCGKSTLLRALNRLDERRPGTRTTGTITLDGEDIHRPDMDLRQLRRRVGMIFSQPRLLPGSVFDNVAFGLRAAGVDDHRALTDRVETALRRAALWDDVRDRLADDARALSPGAAQQLCIARALAVGPEVLLLDDPTGALDPIATARIEEYAGYYGITRSQLYPQVALGAGASRQLGSVGGADLANRTYNTYDMLLSASWEIDLWGKIRRQSEAARAQIVASVNSSTSVNASERLANSRIGLD